MVRTRSRRSYLAGDEMPRQGVEQLGMDRRVGPAHVVGRVDQALAEELRPDPVGRGPGEIGVIGRRHPVGQGLARIFVGGDLHGLAVEQPRLDRLLGPQMNDLALGIDRDRCATHHRAAAAAALDLGEERSQAVVGVLGPDVEGVVVALGAADAQAQEPLRRQLGLDVGLERVHRVVDRPALLDVGRVAHRGQERPDDFVPRLVLAQAADRSRPGSGRPRCPAGPS